jgi:hypothetical protein
LIYKLEQGEKSWADEAMKKRGTYVKPKTSPPSFCPSLMFIWNSFWELSTTRHEMGPIPWTAVNEYCKRWGIDDSQEFDEFMFFIRGIDGAFLKYQSDDIKRKRNATTNKGNKK